MAMKTLMEIALLLAWLAAYLGVTYGVGNYRRGRLRALGIGGRSDFRAEKDWGVWLALLVTGILLGATAFFAAQTLGARM
jgi:hypothetical protein